ncbi:MAG: AAA family ATPase [Gammaproteobacteria bacterium]|nr:AAA family ATPase [Gammaproteobacteria bacterium]
MKTTLIVNPKGGCGKSTLATNLASYYALWDVPVALVDYDPQQSSIEWLAQRDSGLNPIHGVDASHGHARLPAEVQRVVLDAPARIDKAQLKRLFQFADRAIVPVLPSPLDIRAAGHFIGELMLDGLLRPSSVALVANRVRKNTVIYRNLTRFLDKLNIPLLAHLRDSQNYIRAAEAGHGIFEMPPYQAEEDAEQWRALIGWVEAGKGK